MRPHSLGGRFQQLVAELPFFGRILPPHPPVAAPCWLPTTRASWPAGIELPRRTDRFLEVVHLHLEQRVCEECPDSATGLGDGQLPHPVAEAQHAEVLDVAF